MNHVAQKLMEEKLPEKIRLDILNQIRQDDILKRMQIPPDPFVSVTKSEYDFKNYDDSEESDLDSVDDDTQPTFNITIDARDFTFSSQGQWIGSGTMMNEAKFTLK